MKILVIQTAFLGDVVLATPIIEKLRQHYPQAQIDLLIRKGNEGLFDGHPMVHHLWVWDKKQGKYKSLWKILSAVRKQRYDTVINVQRFASTGLFTVLSKAKQTIGFSKNPFSLLFSQRYPHRIGYGLHEVERNLYLTLGLTDDKIVLPKLYPQQKDMDRVAPYKGTPYVTLSPNSVWFTKQWPMDRWAQLIQRLLPRYTIYLIGGPADTTACEQLRSSIGSPMVHNLAGQLGLLQSAALMRDAAMNYANDSGPQHMASAVDAPTTAVFCSTVPAFGFGPLSSTAKVVQSTHLLPCRPCGLHGHRKCPLGHFRCATTIEVDSLLF